MDRHPELSGHNPIPAITARAKTMPPPVDLGLVHDVASAEKIRRNPRTVFVETRGAELPDAARLSCTRRKSRRLRRRRLLGNPSLRGGTGYLA